MQISDGINHYRGSITNFFSNDGFRIFLRNRGCRFEVQNDEGSLQSFYMHYPQRPLNKDSLDWIKIYEASVPSAIKPDGSMFVTTSSYIGCIMEIFEITKQGNIEKIVEQNYFWN